MESEISKVKGVPGISTFCLPHHVCSVHEQIRLRRNGCGETTSPPPRTEKTKRKINFTAKRQADETAVNAFVVGVKPYYWLVHLFLFQS
jgi:hypothetical protein